MFQPLWPWLTFLLEELLFLSLVVTATTIRTRAGVLEVVCVLWVEISSTDTAHFLQCFLYFLWIIIPEIIRRSDGRTNGCKTHSLCLRLGGDNYSCSFCWGPLGPWGSPIPSLRTHCFEAKWVMDEVNHCAIDMGLFIFWVLTTVQDNQVYLSWQKIHCLWQAD